MTKAHNQQATHPRNSNLRELPIAPSHSVDMHKRKATSANAAHVIPVATTVPQPRASSAEGAQAAKPANITSTGKADLKVEEQVSDTIPYVNPKPHSEGYFPPTSGSADTFSSSMEKTPVYFFFSF